MNLKFTIALSILSVGVWCPPVFAQRQAAAGPGVIALTPTGALNGVDMSASGTTGTLSVGTLGGPETDIFSSNNPLVVGAPLAISTAVSSQGNIVFNSSSTVYGGIGVTQPGGPFLLNIAGGNAGTNVNFLGPVYATTISDSGTGTLNFQSGSTNIAATNFAGDGTISLAPGTTLIGALTSTAGANTGTLLLGNGSVLNGAVGGATGLKSIDVVGGNDAAGVSALITGAADSYAFNLGTNTLLVGGALTIANSGAGGVINTTLASPSVYGNIRPLGATNLGAALTVNVTVPAASYIPVGTMFNIVSTQTGTVQSGTDGSVVTATIKDPTNPLYTFVAVPLAGTVAGEVTIEATGIPILVPISPVVPVTPLPPTLPIVVPIIPVLISAPQTPGIVSTLAAINALTTPAGVVNAVAQLAPSTPDVATPLLALQETREFQDAWLARMDTICSDVNRRSNDTSYCPAQRSGWWAKGISYFGNQNAKQSYSGYNSRILGTMVGFDVPIDLDTRIGAAVGYANTAIDEKEIDNSTNFNSYEATAYIGHNQGPWFVDGDLSFAWDSYSSTRQIAFPGVSLMPRGSYNGQSYTAFGITGYNFYFGNAALTPLVSLQYTDISIDSYRETGAGALDLKVDSRNYSYLESGLGAKLAGSFRYRGGNFLPEIHVKWLHDIMNPTLSDTAAFSVSGSQSFNTPGMKTAADTFNVGAGLTLLSCSCTTKSWSIDAVYDYYVRSDGYSANLGMIKYARSF